MNSPVFHSRRPDGFSKACLIAAILYLALLIAAPAQELVRTSNIPLPIESFRTSPEEFFRLGPFQEELVGSAGVQYTDNVNLAVTDRISDLSFYQGAKPQYHLGLKPSQSARV